MLTSTSAGHQGVEQNDVGQALPRPLQGRFAVRGDQQPASSSASCSKDRFSGMSSTIRTMSERLRSKLGSRGIAALSENGLHGVELKVAGEIALDANELAVSRIDALDFTELVENATHVAEVEQILK